MHDAAADQRYPILNFIVNERDQADPNTSHQLTEDAREDLE